MSAQCLDLSKDLWGELWISLASLVRSYCAAHSLNSSIQPQIQIDEDRITVRNGERSLELERSGPQVTWTRENGNSGTVRMTDAGRLLGPAGEEEMDFAAEAWAQDLMREFKA